MRATSALSPLLLVLLVSAAHANNLADRKSALEKSQAEPKWAMVHYPPIDYQAIRYYSAPKSKADAPKSLAEIDPELLEAELETILDQAYAVDSGERFDFAHAVAVPIFGADGRPILGMSCVGPSEIMHLTDEYVTWLALIMRSLALEMTDEKIALHLAKVGKDDRDQFWRMLHEAAEQQIRDTKQHGGIAVEMRSCEEHVAVVGEKELLHADVRDTEHQHVVETLTRLRVDGVGSATALAAEELPVRPIRRPAVPGQLFRRLW